MKLHRKILDLLGYHLVHRKTYLRTSHVELENHVQKLIAAYNIDTIIDVGANEGQYLETMREIGFKGKYLCFEPIPELAKKIGKKFSSDPKITVFNHALGQADGELEMNIFDTSVFSSFLKPSDYLKQYMDVKETMKIPVKRLDQCLRDHLTGSENILLKIDTQGYDLEVLKGAEGLLSKVEVIITECSVVPIYEGMPTYIETLAFLDQKGYRPSGFFPITREKESLGLVEFDGVFIKRTMDH